MSNHSRFGCPRRLTHFIIASFAAVLFGGRVGSAQDGAPPKPRAVIESAVHDFGSVIEGTKVKHDFVVHNKGTAPFTIQRIVPSCGCTASSASVETVPPGGQATIHVTFDTTGFAGTKEKSVQILTSDAAYGQLEVRLKGRIETDVTVEPPFVAFGDVVGSHGSLASKRVTVSVRAGADVVLGEARTFSQALIVTPVTSEPTKRVFDVALVPGLSPGTLRDRIVVSTFSGGHEKPLNIPIVAAVKSELSLRPENLSFGIISGEEPLVRKATLTNFGSKPVGIVSVTSSDPALSADYKTVDNGKNFLFELRLDPRRVTTDFRGTVTVITNRQDVGPVALNVYGILPPPER